MCPGDVHAGQFDRILSVAEKDFCVVRGSDNTTVSGCAYGPK